MKTKKWKIQNFCRMECLERRNKKLRFRTTKVLLFPFFASGLCKNGAQSGFFFPAFCEGDETFPQELGRVFFHSKHYLTWAKHRNGFPPKFLWKYSNPNEALYSGGQQKFGLFCVCSAILPGGSAPAPHITNYYPNRSVRLSYFDLFRFISVYFLSQNTIESAKIN